MKNVCNNFEHYGKSKENSYFPMAQEGISFLEIRTALEKLGKI